MPVGTGEGAPTPLEGNPFHFEPYFRADPTGLTMREVKPVVGKTTVLNALGDWLRLPTRGYTATSDTWKKPYEISPFEFAVTAEGKGVPATPTATKLFGYVLLCLLACGAGILGAEAAKNVGYRLGLHHVSDNHYDDRPYWVVVVEGMITSAALATAGLWSATPALFALGIFSIPFWSMGWRLRLKAFATMIGLGALAKLLEIPILPPPDSLVAAYGPLGIYCWDVVATCLIAVVCLAHWIPLSGQRVTYVTVAPQRR